MTERGRHVKICQKMCPQRKLLMHKPNAGRRVVRSMKRRRSVRLSTILREQVDKAGRNQILQGLEATLRILIFLFQSQSQTLSRFGTYSVLQLKLLVQQLCITREKDKLVRTLDQNSWLAQARVAVVKVERSCHVRDILWVETY